MKTWLNTYFEFTKREFNGLLTLVVLIVLVIAFPYVYGFIKPDDAAVNEAEELAILKSLSTKKPAIHDDSHKFLARKPTADKKSIHLFPFDPNTIGLQEWQKLGLSARQAQVILTYKARGGQFRKTADLQKMYTINDHTYQQLAPYVKIAPKNGTEDQPKPDLRQVIVNHRVKRELRIIEINGADTTELDEIKGIGRTFADRIVKYRDRIGGFYKKEQLMEIFGLDSVKYSEIKDQVTINATKLKKININTARIEDFKNHPYIRYKQVNALIEYRKQHGNYSNIADLNKVAIITPETVIRLAPYLEF